MCVDSGKCSGMHSDELWPARSKQYGLLPGSMLGTSITDSKKCSHHHDNNQVVNSWRSTLKLVGFMGSVGRCVHYAGLKHSRMRDIVTSGVMF